MEQTVKKKIGVRDIMTIAAMMVINFAIAMVIGTVTLPFPVVYLYGSAGIDAFVGATFYLVAANRINKHGLLFAWAAVYGLIQGIMGYTALLDELSVAFLSGSLLAVQTAIPKIKVNIIVIITIFLIHKSSRYSQCPLLCYGYYSFSAPITLGYLLSVFLLLFPFRQMI